MAESDLELVRRLFAAFETGSIEPAIELMSDDFVLVVPPSMSAEPDTYEGPEGARRYMAAFDGVVDDVRFEADELHVEDGCVIALVSITGRGAASGLDVHLRAASIISVNEGKITAIESHPDLESARKALRGRG